MNEVTRRKKELLDRIQKISLFEKKRIFTRKLFVLKAKKEMERKTSSKFLSR